MKFFIDTADVQEIREACELGVIDGVTTNPTLLAKTGRSLEEVIPEICSLVDGPISVEAVSQQAEEIIPEARRLAEFGPQVVIKIPCTVEGLKATRALQAEGIRVNMTLVFSPSQALLAAKAGAAYISPFVGRVDDISQVGMAEVEKIIEIYRNYNFQTEIIVASIRHPLHVVEAALLGADIATIPYRVIMQLIQHPLTDIGIRRFLADWEKIKQK